MPTRPPVHRPHHAKPSASGFKRDDRLSRHERGYDLHWTKLRQQVLAEEPLCRRCQAEGRVTAATHVHHQRGFAGLHDPLRLDRRWLEPLCRPCHMREEQGKAVQARA